MVVADRKEGRMWGGPWYKPPYFEVPEFGMSGSTLEGIRLRKLHEGIRGGGGITSLPSTFDTFHPID